MSYSNMGFQTLSTDLPNSQRGTPHGSHVLAAGSAWTSELERDDRQVARTDGRQSQAATGSTGRHEHPAGALGDAARFRPIGLRFAAFFLAYDGRRWEVEPSEKKGYRKPSHRQLGLRMDQELEAALEASAAKFERTLSQEARYGLKVYLGIYRSPAEETAGVSV